MPLRHDFVVTPFDFAQNRLKCSFWCSDQRCQNVPSKKNIFQVITKNRFFPKNRFFRPQNGFIAIKSVFFLSEFDVRGLVLFGRD